MNLERIILENLARVHPHMLATGTLWSEVRMDDATATFTAYTTALRHLEEKGQAVVILGEDRNKARITAAGQARLAE